MSLSTITLPTNKSISVVDDNVRTLRQSESGLVLPVIVEDANGEAYDLTDKSIVFSERKDSGKIVVDDGRGDSNSSSIEVTDAKAGKFTYKLNLQCYTASGSAWFEIKSGNDVIDTTKNFKINVLPEASIHVNNDNYVSTMNGLEDTYKGVVQKANQDWTAKLAKINSGYQSKMDDLANLKSDWQTQTATIQNNADDQLAKIKQAASDQSTAIQNKADSQLADEVKAIETKRDQAISDATAKFNANVSDWTKQFNGWLAQTKSDYTTDIADLNKQLSDVKSGINEVVNTDYPNMQSKLKDVEDAVAKAQANFDSIDFSSYAKKADVYTKIEVNSMLDAAGKLQTISINGGTPIDPDENKNININIPAPDLSNYLTSTDAQSTYETQADAKTLSDKVNANTSAINTKADKTDITNLTNQITTQQTELDDLKKNSGGKLIPISQADYDKLTDAQKKNGWYAIG